MARLLGINLSPFVRKVLIFAHEAGIELDHHDDVLPVPPHEGVLAINPRGKIPAYEDEDIKLGESAVICAYLDRKHGGTGLYPDNAADYGMALWYEKWNEEELIPKLASVFFQRVVQPMMGGETDEQAVAASLAAQPPLFEFLNQRLQGKEFLAGSQFSIADISLVSTFVNHRLAGEDVAASDYPELSRYLKSMAKRESVAKVLTMANTSF